MLRAKKHNCSIKGCPLAFDDADTTLLHEASSWHCTICGFSDDRLLTGENVTDLCTNCAESDLKCVLIRVEFKKKAYAAHYPDKRPVCLSVKENGRWVHYD